MTTKFVIYDFYTSEFVSNYSNNPKNWDFYYCYNLNNFDMHQIKNTAIFSLCEEAEKSCEHLTKEFGKYYPSNKINFKIMKISTDNNESVITEV